MICPWELDSLTPNTPLKTCRFGAGWREIWNVIFFNIHKKKVVLNLFHSELIFLFYSFFFCFVFLIIFILVYNVMLLHNTNHLFSLLISQFRTDDTVTSQLFQLPWNPYMTICFVFLVILKYYYTVTFSNYPFRNTQCLWQNDKTYISFTNGIHKLSYFLC